MFKPREERHPVQEVKDVTLKVCSEETVVEQYPGNNRVLRYSVSQFSRSPVGCGEICREWLTVGLYSEAQKHSRLCQYERGRAKRNIQR